MKKLFMLTNLNLKKISLGLALGLVLFLPALAWSADSGMAFFNPIEHDSVESMIQKLTENLYSFVVGLTLVFIILGGILYMLSAGDPAMIKRAYNCWVFSLIGFAIVVAAPTFLQQIVDVLKASGSVSPGGKSITEIIATTLNLLLALLGMLCIAGLTMAGGMYMTAYSDEKRLETAKTIAKYSIIGLVVALSALVAITQIEELISD